MHAADIIPRSLFCLMLGLRYQMDEVSEGKGVGHKLDEAQPLGERHHRVGLYAGVNGVHLASVQFSGAQLTVADVEELLDPLVLAQVLARLHDEGIGATVAAHHLQGRLRIRIRILI